MSSLFEKVVAEARRADRKTSGTLRNRLQTDNIQSDEIGDSGLFSALSMASVEQSVMERNKIMPAVNDRRAITAYKVLRTRVLQQMRSHGWRNLVVTGAGPGEGKTITACNLAISISNDVNQSVFLVDVDLQRPSVADYFGLEVHASIGDYLRGEAEISDIIYAPEDMDRIAIIPNRDPVGNSSELLASPRMKKLLKWLAEHGGAPLAIFDTPPVLACDDVLAFSPLIDAYLMVVSEGKTDRASLSRTIEMLNDCNLLGVVLNRSRELSAVSHYY